MLNFTSTSDEELDYTHFQTCFTKDVKLRLEMNQLH